MCVHISPQNFSFDICIFDTVRMQCRSSELITQSHATFGIVCCQTILVFFIFHFKKHKKMTEKLGEKALQAMKEMNTAIVEFKVPRAPKMKKGQMKILTEERYIEVSGNNFCRKNSL